MELLDNTLMIQRVQAAAPAVLMADSLLLRDGIAGHVEGAASGDARKPKRKAAEGAAAASRAAAAPLNKRACAWGPGSPWPLPAPKFF